MSAQCHEANMCVCVRDERTDQWKIEICDHWQSEVALGTIVLPLAWSWSCFVLVVFCSKITRISEFYKNKFSAPI